MGRVASARPIAFLWRIPDPGSRIATLLPFPSVSINIPAALDRLCYRYPSALVDAIAEHDPGRRIVAYKNVTVSEEFFQGHFPGAPLMPGVLMIETLAQVATILLTQSGDDGRGARAYLRGVDNAKF